MANNNYPQITSVTSESLQAQIRNLLPSQEGFGTDLMAQNVIVPIIDLTEAAEGSSVPEYLQTALAFGSQTAFTGSVGGATIANTAGFWRITGTMGVYSGTSCSLDMSDGLSTKTVYKLEHIAGGTVLTYAVAYDFTVFLDSGDSVIAKVSSANAYHLGSARQVADINGALINPNGFNPQ